MWLALALALLVGLSAAKCKPDSTTTIPVEKYKGVIIGMSVVFTIVILVCLLAVFIFREDKVIQYESRIINLLWAIIIASLFFFPLFFTPSAVWGTLIKSIYWKDVNFSVSNITLTEDIHCCVGPGYRCYRICSDACVRVSLNVDVTVLVTDNHTELCTYQYSRQCGPDIDEIKSCINSTINALLSAKRRADPNNYRSLSKNFIWTAEKIMYMVLAAISGFILVIGLVIAIVVSIYFAEIKIIIKLNDLRV
jgi:hypothetical protein